jgi:hypothetical protein
MLAQEFWALTQDTWELYPRETCNREIDGTIIYDTTNDPVRFRESQGVDYMLDPPAKIQEDQGRGMAINSKADQDGLLQYWAWARQDIAAGVAFNINGFATEFWMTLALESLEDDDEGRAYAGALHQLWIWKLRQVSPRVAADCDTVTDFSYSMRCQGNALKVWFVPRAHYEGGITKSLAEQPISKDKSFTNDMIAYSQPTMSDDIAVYHASILFGGRIQERYPDPEVQGRKIALVAVNNNIVQKPPNSLDRMHASLRKQVAYSQRLLSAENEIAGINCDIAEFLSQMRVNPSEPITVCVNAGGSFKLHEQHLGGQLWLQGDRPMTATNIQFEGMSNDAVSVTLSAVAEAVQWARTLEIRIWTRKMGTALLIRGF